MKMYLKTIIIASVLILTVVGCKEENVNTKKIDLVAEKEAVSAVMKSYKDAIQNLTTEGTIELFTKEATVFESGGSEGTYANYVAHHLGPELDYFKSFVFSDYVIDVEIDMPFSFVSESYVYTLVIKGNKEHGTEEKTIKKRGVATTSLKKIDGKWKITKTHSSSRGLRSGH